MPPHVASKERRESEGESESESDGDLILPKKPVPAKASQPQTEAQMNDGDDEAEDDGEEFVVEAIKDHKYIGKVLHFHVKWKGYPKASDMTWEPETNCEHAEDVVEEYFNSIGGRPTQGEKRKRKSNGAGTPSSTIKKARRSIANKTSTGGRSSFASPTNGDEGETSQKPFQPPDGSWEDSVSVIDTIEKNNEGLNVFVQWADGTKARYPIEVMYERCPQRMLQFYEQHLVFKESGSL